MIGGFIVGAAGPMAWIGALATTAPGTTNSDLVYLIAAALAGGIVTQLMASTLRRQTKDQLIAAASHDATEAARGLLNEYRTELRMAKTEITELRERVAKLEEALKQAAASRERVEGDLKGAQEKLVIAEQRVKELEGRTHRLEGSVERRASRRDS